MTRKNVPLQNVSRNPNVRSEFRKARINLRKTQKEMAEDLEVTEVYIRHVENKHLNPSIKKMILFESYLKVPAKILFSDLYDEAKSFIAK